MVLSSLDIHGLNVSRMTLVFFCLMISWLHSSVLGVGLVGGLVIWRLQVLIPVGMHYFQNNTLLECCVQANAPVELSVNGFNFSRFLAVANYTNINSND